MLHSLFIFLFVSIFSTWARADWRFADEGSLYSRVAYSKIESTNMGTKFIQANERTPEDALGIYQGLQQGVYVSVGFERSFLAAAASDKITHLLIFDVEPKILEFARFNILLLKVARDLEDYLYLRMKASHIELVERFGQANLSPHYFEWAIQSKLFSDWALLMRENLTMSGHPLRKRYMPGLFKNVNYTEDQQQFEKIQAMARAGRIRTFQGDISTKFAVETVNKRLNGLKISAIDISNAWRWDYLATMGLYRMLESWTGVISSDTQLILSVFNAKFIIGKRWVYMSFPMLKLLDKSIASFRAELHEWEIFGGKKFKRNAFNDLPQMAYSCRTVLFD